MPESISAIYYIIKKKWLWQLALIGAGLLLLPLMLNVTLDVWKFLVFFTCGGLVYTGCSPLFKERPQGVIHYFSSILCCISAVMWCVVGGNLPIVIISSIGAIFMSLLYPKNCIFWIEIAVIVLVIMCLVKLHIL